MTKYLIESIEPKRPDYKNKWYSRVIGKTCEIAFLEESVWGAYLLIYGVVDYDYADMPLRYRTTPVLKTEEKDGVLTIETVNSVYTLRMLL